MFWENYSRIDNFDNHEHEWEYQVRGLQLYICFYQIQSNILGL